MNKKIKIIDIFNIISKKDYEALPLSIEVDGKKYNWDTMEHFYAREDKNREDLLELATIYDTVTFLDMNVEILEDSTEEIEELNPNDIYFKDGTELVYKLMYDKINELVKVVKEIRKEKE
jgi:fatty acid-binding protein DegV